MHRETVVTTKENFGRLKLFEKTLLKSDKNAVHLREKMIGKTLIWERKGDFQVWVQFCSVLRRHSVSVMTSASM